MILKWGEGGGVDSLLRTIILNRDKFQVILLDKSYSDNNNMEVKTGK